MLELLARCLSSSARRKMFFSIGIAHIDESAVRTFETDTDVGAEIAEIAATYDGVEYHSVPLADAFDATDDEKDGNERLRELFASLNGPSDKDDMLHYLRMKLLASIATEHGYNKVALGECADRVAVKAMANVSCQTSITTFSCTLTPRSRRAKAVASQSAKTCSTLTNDSTSRSFVRCATC